MTPWDLFRFSALTTATSTAAMPTAKTHHPNTQSPVTAWHPIYMSISRHLDEYCAVEGITPSAEVDVEGLSSCHQFLPSPGVDVSTTDPLSRLEHARATLAATL